MSASRIYAANLRLTTLDPERSEEIISGIGSVNLFASGAFAERLAGQLVRIEVEGDGAFFSDAGEGDPHQVGDAEAEVFEDGCRLVFDVGADSGADYGVGRHD